MASWFSCAFLTFCPLSGIAFQGARGYSVVSGLLYRPGCVGLGWVTQQSVKHPDSWCEVW